MRQMATIRKIDEVRPIEGADAIECCVVGGWQVVTRLGEFKVGDLAVYCEIDSWIPTALASFLSKGKEPRVYEGIAGERLRTVKLRGQLSQGLLLNLDDVIPETHSFDEGADVSEYLGIIKFEAPIPACLGGQIIGAFPGWIPKTDQERIQNLTVEFEEWKTKGLTFEVTEKLDGSSMTVFMCEGEFGICSRNWELRETEGNTLWSIARRHNLEKVLGGRHLALQGEVIGEGIQGNMYKGRGQEFYIFDIYNIDTKRYMTPVERTAFVTEHNLKHVPVFKKAHVLTETVAELLAGADGHSRSTHSFNQSERL